MPIPNAKVVIKGFLKVILATLVFFAIAESLIRVAYFIRNSMVDYVPLPYVIAGDYGPPPPWLDNRKLIKPDETLVWRGQPNIRRKYVDVFSPVHTEDELRSLQHRFFPALPDSLKANPVWGISTNSEGFRDAEFPKNKSLSAFRIICLGDSWTFGSNVGQNEAYPQRLRALLRQEFPEANFEVFNLGVLGYASYNGLKLLKTRAINLDPDFVVLAFAMNEPGMAGYQEKNATSNEEHISLTKRIGGVLAKIRYLVSENIEFYKLLRHWALLIKWQPKSIGEYLKDQPHILAWFEKEWDYDKLEPWMQVSLRDYEKYLLEMINLARNHDAGVVLVYNVFWRKGPYRRVLEKISRAKGVALVDSSALLAETSRKIEEELERKLDLRPPRDRRALAKGEIEVIFRVYLEKRPVPKTIYIAGTHPKLGDLVPNKVAMYDDGTHGDQRAGDKVWSYSATFSPETMLYYVYTNSGEEGKWEGLDVPDVRYFKVETPNNEQVVYRPIDSFGKMYMKADPWHTNAAGYELIAKALLEKLKKGERVKGYLKQNAGKKI